MNSFLLSLGPLAQLMGAPQGGEAQPGSTWMTILPFVAIVAIFYFLILRPQNKKQKETQKMLSALKKGDRVVTVGGIHGVIQSVKDNTVIVRVDENVKLEFNRAAISNVERQAKDDSDDKKADEKKLEAPAEKSGENSGSE